MTQALAAQITGDAAIQVSGPGTTQSLGTSTCNYLDTFGIDAVDCAPEGQNPTNCDTATLDIITESSPISQSDLQAASQAAGGAMQQVSGLGDGALEGIVSNGAAILFADGEILTLISATSTTRSGSAMYQEEDDFARQLAAQGL